MFMGVNLLVFSPAEQLMENFEMFVVLAHKNVYPLLLTDTIDTHPGALAT